jgi:hypothetical protein
MYNHPLNTKRYFGLACKADTLASLMIEYLQLKIKQKKYEGNKEIAKKIAEDILTNVPSTRINEHDKYMITRTICESLDNIFGVENEEE